MERGVGRVVGDEDGRRQLRWACGGAIRANRASCACPGRESPCGNATTAWPATDARTRSLRIPARTGDCCTHSARNHSVCVPRRLPPAALSSRNGVFACVRTDRELIASKQAPRRARPAPIAWTAIQPHRPMGSGRAPARLLPGGRALPRGREGGSAGTHGQQTSGRPRMASASPPCRRGPRSTEVFIARGGIREHGLTGRMNLAILIRY
jgi:hypothetical protein